MVTRDLIDNITAIMTRPDLEGQPAEVRGDIVARAEDERAELAGQLRLARDEGGEDPLLAVVERARDRTREFAEPRPYRLEDLARAAGMSISGIRTAYDDDEIGEVTAITRLAPRRRTAL